MQAKEPPERPPELAYEEIVRRIARRIIFLNKVLSDRERRRRMSKYEAKDAAEELEALEAALPLLRVMEQAQHGEWD